MLIFDSYYHDKRGRRDLSRPGGRKGETGETGKAFLLPQKDPMFYDNYTYTYNRPELIKTAVKNGKEFEKIIQQAAIPSTPKKIR